MKTSDTNSTEPIGTTAENLRRTITHHPFLKALTHEHLEIVTCGGEEITFQPGEVVFREGQPANRFYLIQEGQIALEAHDYVRGDTLIEKIGKGDVLGWSWLFEPFVWHFQARALEHTRFIALDGGHLLVSCEKNHSFGYELMNCVSKVVVHRLEATCRKLIEAQPRPWMPRIQAREPDPEPPFTVEAAVARHPFFNRMSAAHLRVLVQQAMPARFEAGQLIFEAGAPANRFYVIEKGQLAVESESPTGPVLIEVLSDGDELGWSWLYAPYYCHFNVRALQPTSAIFFYGTRLREACESDHDLGYELMKRTTRVVIERLQATRRQLLQCATHG